ncbi:MAG: hypothetical protein ABEJ08_05660 [Halobacteriaceae archaeon]
MDADDLPPGDRHLLAVLAGESGPLYVAQVVYRTPFDTEAVRQRCRRLADRGLVEWPAHCMVRTTPRGHALVEDHDVVDPAGPAGD